MNSKDFDKLVEGIYEEELRILKEKGREYSQGDDDRLHNFKQGAKDMGLHPFNVWYIYFYKHYASIISYIKSGKEFSDESIQGRIADARNYLLLFQALIEDLKNEGKPAPQEMVYTIPAELVDAAKKISGLQFSVVPKPLDSKELGNLGEGEEGVAGLRA